MNESSPQMIRQLTQQRRYNFVRYVACHVSETHITLLFVVIAIGVPLEDSMEACKGVMAPDGGGLGGASPPTPIIEIFVGDLAAQPTRTRGHRPGVLFDQCDIQDLIS